MEAIQHMTLKFDIGDLLTISYPHTHFRPNMKGVVIFCVDLARNDPYASDQSVTVCSLA